MVVSLKSKLSVATVVIPAAGGSRDVLGRNSDYPAALIRLGSKPIVFIAIEYLIEQGFTKFRIGVTPKHLPNFKNALRVLEKRATIEYLEGEPGESALGTIWRLVSELPKENPILVNLGDTLCKWDSTQLSESSPVILIDKVPENERWSTANISPEGTITSVFGKGMSSGGEYGICGVFWWPKGRDLISAFPTRPNSGDIADLLRPHIENGMRGEFPEVWCDSDHGDMRENSRHRILESRSFNSIEINDFRGTIKKSSTNTEKLIREIQYYRNLPSELKIFFPRMIGFSEVLPMVFQELEYYSYPTLADIYCFEDAPIFVWSRILEKLSRITFREFAQDHFTYRDPQVSLNEIFVGKTQKRNIQLAQENSALSDILQLPNLVINEKRYFGVNQILSRSTQVLEILESPWTIVHGDFCLSNILSEPDTNNIKMIDPRGGFDSASCFGPQIYDVAKLGHSLVGRYDLIIADKFILNLDRIEASEIALEILESPLHSQIEDEFLATYLNGNVNKDIAKLLSGLILLSIPGFHREYPDRAIAMLIQGIRICNQALEELQ